MTEGTESGRRVAAWDMGELDRRRMAAKRPYLEFLRVSDLSAGLYVIEAGEVDRQRPHTEDEIYAVLGGRGWLRMGDDDVAVGPGSIAFVAAGVEHRFHDVSERLTVLVAFGPAECSRDATSRKAASREAASRQAASRQPASRGSASRSETP